MVFPSFAKSLVHDELRERITEIAKDDTFHSWWKLEAVIKVVGVERRFVHPRAGRYCSL
jgi:hypothetical protein